MKSDDTVDSIWSNQVKIRQPKKGYRFALDSVLLADFIRTDARESVLEIGCGTGVVIVLLAQRHSFRDITGIEIQQELAEYAACNLQQNRINNGRILAGDVKELYRTLPSESFDVIVSNPPYRKLGSGKLNPSSEKAVARHELRIQLADLFECANHLLKQDGRTTLILPEFRRRDFDTLIKKHKYFVTELRSVHSFADQPPAFFLATASKSSSPCIEHPQLVIYEKQGEYTAEAHTILFRPSFMVK